MTSLGEMISMTVSGHFLLRERSLGNKGHDRVSFTQEKGPSYLTGSEAVFSCSWGVSRPTLKFEGGPCRNSGAFFALLPLRKICIASKYFFGANYCHQVPRSRQISAHEVPPCERR